VVATGDIRSRMGAARGRLRSLSWLRWLDRARLDVKDRLTGTRDPLMPPRRWGLPSQFPSVGARLLNQALIDSGGLKPNEHVLDIGCGAGRVAAQLTRYLDPASGSYEGFDVMPKAIDWAQKKITTGHSNFRFQLAEVRNDEYNREATVDASTFQFPYADGEFDLTFALSLYTHMFPFQLSNYLRETARVLRPGGRAVATFFLLNPEVEELIAERVTVPWGAEFKLSDDLDDGHGGHYRTRNPDRPEARMVLHEDDVRERYEQAGLQITEVRYGRWCGRKKPATLGQDLLVAVK
jgi:SAM-dependent methyltransferase